MGLFKTFKSFDDTLSCIDSKFLTFDVIYTADVEYSIFSSKKTIDVIKTIIMTNVLSEFSTFDVTDNINHTFEYLCKKLAASSEQKIKEDLLKKNVKLVSFEIDNIKAAFYNF